MSGVIRLPNNHIYAHSPIFGGTRKRLGDSVHTDVIQRYSIAGNTLSNCGGHRMWSHLSCCQHSRQWILTRHRHTDTRQVSILSMSGQNPCSKMLTMRPRNLLSHRIFIDHGHGVSLAHSCMPNVHIRFVGDTGGQVQERSPCHRAASSAAPQAARPRKQRGPASNPIHTRRIIGWTLSDLAATTTEQLVAKALLEGFREPVP
jgi:hypothetical protein